MTPAQLIPILRDEYLEGCFDGAPEAVVEDATAYKTPFLLREIGTAQRRACWRGDMKRIFDDTTTEVCSITLVAGTQSYDLDGRILIIDQILHDGCKLMHTTREAMDVKFGQTWRSWSAGVPRGFFIRGRRLFLNRAPGTLEAGTTLDLSVWREPLATPGMNDHLEIDIDPQPLASWVTYRALMRPNVDKFDRELAAVHLNEFDSYFGSEVSKPERDDILAYPSTIDVMTGNAVFPGMSRGFDYE